MVIDLFVFMLIGFLNYLGSDISLMGAAIGAVIGGFFAIIGSLIGGWVTYLSVILTFKKQEKNEIPKKLIILTRISSDIRKYIKDLSAYKAGSTTYRRDLDSEKFREKLLVKSANVDKESYRMIVNAFDGFDNKDYSRILVVRPELHFTTKAEFQSLAENYHADVLLLQANIDRRIKYYEQKI